MNNAIRASAQHPNQNAASENSDKRKGEKISFFKNVISVLLQDSNFSDFSENGFPYHYTQWSSFQMLAENSKPMKEEKPMKYEVDQAKVIPMCF